MIKISKKIKFQILFMGDFYYQTHHILERHLKVGEKLSLKQLVNSQTSPIKMTKYLSFKG